MELLPMYTPLQSRVQSAVSGAQPACVTYSRAQGGDTGAPSARGDSKGAGMKVTVASGPTAMSKLAGVGHSVSMISVQETPCGL